MEHFATYVQTLCGLQVVKWVLGQQSKVGPKFGFFLDWPNSLISYFKEGILQCVYDHTASQIVTCGIILSLPLLCGQASINLILRASLESTKRNLKGYGGGLLFNHKSALSNWPHIDLCCAALFKCSLEHADFLSGLEKYWWLKTSAKKCIFRNIKRIASAFFAWSNFSI